MLRPCWRVPLQRGASLAEGGILQRHPCGGFVACQSVRQSDTCSLWGRNDCRPLRTILCQRKCALAAWPLSVKDMPLSEEMWSSQVVLGRPLERLRERSGYRQIVRMLDTGTSRLNMATWLNNPTRRAPAMLMMLSKLNIINYMIFFFGAHSGPRLCVHLYMLTV